MREYADDEGTATDSPRHSGMVGAPGGIIEGRYRVDGVLGRGGMGEVFQVHDQVVGRDLALKRVSGAPERRAARLQSQFEREYHLLVELAHPNIIEVYDYGLDALGAYYTMELLAGHDLRDSAPMPWQRVCEVLRDVASALAVVHSRRLVHRDVTSRNVRLAQDGRAKLIDFGATVPMGPAKGVVGTPPFVAPETVQQQSLDGRADLYALGALAYCMLTGRHAYPAKRLEQLRDFWRTPPIPPQRLVPEVPRALGELVMTLLSMERGMRPASAAEVMARVIAIGDLPSDERAGVPRAYLTTPTLVGREQALVVIRRAMIEALRGSGNAFVVKGPPGVGRSRFLDACVLEGKLAGATVLRADPSDACEGRYGALRTAISQLAQANPDAAGRLEALGSSVTAFLRTGLVEVATSGELEQHERHGPSMEDGSRRGVLDSLVLWLRATARDRVVMLAIDDLQSIDEASAGFFAGLATDLRNRRLVMVATATELPDGDGDAVHVLSACSETIPLVPLSEPEVRSLLASVFGEVRNLPVVAARLYSLSGGNPRGCMQLAQHLVDQGLARYEAGYWQLPKVLRASELPENLSDALLTRIARVSQDARELGEAFALLLGEAIPIDRISMLAGDGRPAKVFGCLDELVAAQTVQGADMGYTLLDRDLAHTLVSQIPEERRAQLHRRVARFLQVRGDDGRRVAEHQFLAGDEVSGVSSLLAWCRQQQSWSDGHADRDLWLLRTAIDACQSLARAPRERIDLQMALVRLSLSLRVPDCREYAQDLVATLDRLAGLDIWRASDHIADPGERLSHALSGAQARYDASPERDGLLSPLEAVAALADVERQLSAVASGAADPALLEMLPSLVAYQELSPALELVELVKGTAGHVLAGRLDRALPAIHAVLDRIEQPDHAGLSDDLWPNARANVLYAVAVLEGTACMESAFERADALERSPLHEVNAWLVRMNTYLRLGDEDAARACRRRAELLALQGRPAQSLEGTLLVSEVEHYARNRDVMGIKSILGRLRAMADMHPGWEPYHGYALAAYDLVRGDAHQAEQRLAQLARAVEPGAHPVWPGLVSVHVDALLEMDEAQRAEQLAQRYRDEAERAELTSVCHQLTLAHAQAAAVLGRPEALSLAEDALAALEAGPMRMMYGAVPSYRAAVVACHLRDRRAFDRHAHKLVRMLRSSNTSSYGALYQSMREAARRAGFELDHRFTLSDEVQLEQERRAAAIVKATLSDVRDEQERAQRALPLLIRSCCATGAVIYRIEDSGPVLWAYQGASECDRQETDRVAREYVEAMRLEGELTASTVDTGDGAMGRVVSTVTGAAYHPLALGAAVSSGAPMGLVVFTTDAEDQLCINWQTLWAVGNALFE